MQPAGRPELQGPLLLIWGTTLEKCHQQALLLAIALAA